jgi:hypothetical protein
MVNKKIVPTTMKVCTSYDIIFITEHQAKSNNFGMSFNFKKRVDATQ